MQQQASLELVVYYNESWKHCYRSEMHLLDIATRGPVKMLPHHLLKRKSIRHSALTEAAHQTLRCPSTAAVIALSDILPFKD